MRYLVGVRSSGAYKVGGACKVGAFGDLYQLACAEKLLDQNPAPWSPPKAGIWARELVYIVCARTGIVYQRAVSLARGGDLPTQAKEKRDLGSSREADYTIHGTKNNQCCRRSSSSCNRVRLRSKVTHSGSILEELRAKSEHHGSILRILSKHGYCKVRVSREVGYCAAVSGWPIQSKWSRRMSSQPIIVISSPKIVLFIRAQEFMP